MTKMSMNKCRTSSISPQNKLAEYIHMEPCEKTRNKIINEMNPALISEPIEKTQRARLSSSEDDMQDTPLDFSLPKRFKVNLTCPQTSSPPLNMSSQRTTPDYSCEVGSNGSKSPPNLFSEHSNNSNFEMYGNGHVVTSRVSPELFARERSHSLSSIRHVICHPSHGMSSSSSGVPLSTHHHNDPALIHNVTLPATYSDLNPQTMPTYTSPQNINCMSNLKPDVLHLYNDRISKLSADSRHYAFLSSGVPSCIAENLSRNNMITSHPNVLHSAVPGSTLFRSMPTNSVTPTTSVTKPTKPVAKVKSTSPTPTVTTSATTTTAKRRPRSLPDSQKDEAYWERRRKNNEAAKRSRDARRLKEEEIASRANMLERENIQLQSKVNNLKTETEKLRILLYDN